MATAPLSDLRQVMIRELNRNIRRTRGDIATLVGSAPQGTAPQLIKDLQADLERLKAELAAVEAQS